MTARGYKACRICHGLAKKRCCFCGQVVKRKMDMTLMEQVQYDARKEEVAWLREMFWKMKHLNMTTTGAVTLDDRIREEIGEWRW